jgi:hypothetical protein
MAIASVDERLKKYKDLYQPQMQEQINAVNQTAEQQKAAVRDMYNAEIDKTKQSYEDAYRQNAVQKYVNERQIAENMANLGLTDSGLNRTQQTAVQLSYSNTRSKIDRQLQSAVDAFVVAMNSKLSDIETSRIGNEASIKQSYDNAALTAAQKEYQTDYENETARQIAAMREETERQKAYYSALSKASSESAKKSTTKLDSNIASFKNASNGNIIYTDNNGNSVTVPKGHNPYNNKLNQDVLTDGKYDASKVFSNRYQPNNIGGNKVKNSGYPKIIQTNAFGKPAEQTVWKYESGKTTKYAVWSGADNAYFEVKKNKSGNWVVVGKAR